VLSPLKSPSARVTLTADEGGSGTLQGPSDELAEADVVDRGGSDAEADDDGSDAAVGRSASLLHADSGTSVRAAQASTTVRLNSAIRAVLQHR
jgi:hypothetical protein